MNIPLSGSITFLGSNQNNPIRSLTSIQSCCRSTFQDTDTFHILRIQIGDTVTSVPVSGICSTTDCRISLFSTDIQHRHAVYDIKRLIITGCGTNPPKTHFRRTSYTGGIFIYLHSRSLAGKSCYHINLFHTGEFLPFHFLNGIC